MRWTGRTARRTGSRGLVVVAMLVLSILPAASEVPASQVPASQVPAYLAPAYRIGAPRQVAMDRAGFLATLCSGGGVALAATVRVMLAAVPGATPADRDWAGQVARAFDTRALRCAGAAGSFLSLPSATLDARTLAPGQAPEDASTPFPGLRARASLELLRAGLTLFARSAPEPQLDAVATLSAHPDMLTSGFVQAALGQDHPPAVLAALRALLVATGLHADDPRLRVTAIRALGASGTERAVATLASLGAEPGYGADARVARALRSAQSTAVAWVRIAAVLSLLYNGISVGSVLFMSSAGLAIIFGLMGVINLAQGEFITVGAYTAFCVQQALRAAAPGWIDWYPVAAIPVVFAVTSMVGVLVEVLVVRHLYRRPLMTLLATWAISLLLTNLIRVVFGTQNLQFVTPPYLSGGVQVVGDFLVTWNHLFAIGSAVTAFVCTLALLRWTDLGLFMRAVAQNRAMAGCVGVSTRRTDMLAFGFGAGLAGLGGLALSPIYNVNPTMGTGFVIDSFMVVVLGGVGSLAGTAIAALGIGLVNVGIEPFYGAVAAKVIALLLIIVLIQWRPEGLIAARGRR